jgi:predicted RNase H-like nuclease (RuvC/YqgF family)
VAYLLSALGGLIPGIVVAILLWRERDRRAKAETKVASLLSEIKELDVLFERATGKMKSLEVVVTRKDAAMAKLEKKIAELDSEWLVDQLFGGVRTPDKDPDRN